MKKLNFEIEQADIVDEKPDSQFATAKIRAFSSGNSRNDTYCSEEVLHATAGTIYNKPILYNVNKVFDDFNTHTDPKNSLIAGFVVPDSAVFERLPDDRLSLNVFVKLWKRYSPKAMEIFKRDGGRKKVSVEVDLVDYEEMDNGFINLKDFIYSGICILGDLITEAIPGAQMEMMSFAKKNEEYQEAYLSEFVSRYNDIDFTIPQEVKDNAKKGLEFKKNGGKRGTSVEISNAKYLINNDKITPEKIKQIYQYFSEHKYYDPENYGSWYLWGGNKSMEWAKGIINQMEKQDNIIFENELTFPYKSLKDINPALAGIEPPITLAQANAIARQADAIGSDEKKNGWAIAISSFKKTHVVKNGRWVKKEKTNMEEFEKEKIEEMAEVPKEEAPEPEKDKEAEMAAEPQEPKEESEEEEKEEEEEEKEEEKEEMSLDENLDTVAILAMLGEETSDYGKIAKEEFSKPRNEINYAKVCSAMYGKMCGMAEEIKNLSKENESLKNFKLDVEKKDFEFQVNMTMKEVETNSSMPEENKVALLEESKLFSLENIDAWKNKVKAEAFSYAIKKEEKTEDILRFGNPWGTKDKTKKSSLWD